VRTLYRVLVRSLATRGRVAGLGAVAVLMVLIATAVRGADLSDRTDAAYGLIAGYGLAGLVPITSLVFASAAFGDLVEDRTLVHIWLRPVARWRIVLVALAASLTVVVPFTVVPVTVSALVTGQGGRFAAYAAASSALGVFVYTALFVGLGLRVQRALAWGLVYVLIWEGAIGNVGAGLARIALRLYTRSLLASSTDGLVSVKFGVEKGVAIVVPLAVTVVAVLWTTRSLSRADVA
jgi:ABC-2 type transport system permease protein